MGSVFQIPGAAVFPELFPSCVVSDSFIRPADTIGYAASDIIANDTVAANVVPLSFPVSRAPDLFAYLTRMILRTSNVAASAGTQVQLTLFSTPPVLGYGDNGPFSSTNSGWLGTATLTIAYGFADAAVAVLDVTPPILARPAPGLQNIYGVLTSVGPYTPISGEMFSVDIYVKQQ